MVLFLLKTDQGKDAPEPVRKGGAQRSLIKGHCIQAPVPHFPQGCMLSVRGIPQGYLLRNGYQHSVCMQLKGLQDTPLGARLVCNTKG